MGEEVVSVEYGPLGTLAKMTTDAGEEWAPDRYEPEEWTPAERRLAVLARNPEPAACSAKTLGETAGPWESRGHIRLATSDTGMVLRASAPTGAAAA